jgi:orotate phosphoribosyltransferase
MCVPRKPHLNCKKKVFDVVGGLAVAADIFAATISAVLHGLMGGKFLAHLNVEIGLLGVQL